MKPWILDARPGCINPFVLVEDGDSGHGGGKAINPVQRKEEIENLWQARRYERYRIGTIIRCGRL